MNAATKSTDKPIEQAALSVEGMTCASCVAHVEKAIKSVDGVKNYQVNLARGRAVVDFDPARTSPTAVASAIEQSGYLVHEEDPSASLAHAEHERLSHQHAHAQGWLKRAIIAAALWLPVELTHWVLYLTTPAGHSVDQHHFWMNWVALVTSTIALIFVGSGFYKGAWSALKHGTSNMDVLIAMGASVAYFYSLVAFVGYLAGWWGVLPNLYFMESTGLLALISFGHWLEARARDKAGSAIRELLNLAPATALLMEDAEKRRNGDAEKGKSFRLPIVPTADTQNAQAAFREVPVSEVHRGDRLLVRPGDRVPVDGLVLEGQSDVDESMISGESMPVTKSAGDKVIGGTTNHNGRLIIKATQVGAETALAQIVRLVESAQSSKPPVQQLADRISAIFVPVVLGIALVTGVAWYAWGAAHSWPAAQTWARIAQTVCSVLIIACPCALGLAVPATLMVGIGRGARRGILIRDIDALQSAERIDTVVLDKTGTVTLGKPVVKEIHTSDGVREDELIRLAAAAEQFSEHPAAKAIVNYARSRNISIPETQSFTNEPGLGVVATMEGKTTLVGNRSLIEKYGTQAPVSSAGGKIGSLVRASNRDRRAARTTSETTVFVALKLEDGAKILGSIDLSDQTKPDSADAIVELHKLNLHTVLLTGDNRVTAEKIAGEVGIEDVRAEVKPAEKAKVIRELQAGGNPTQSSALAPQRSYVAMVGDGINDAPALAAADLGIAIGSGSDIAKETGDLVLVSGSLHGIATAIRLSRATMRKIRQNLFLAFIYNVLAIPLAALGLLHPLVAAAAMALSDVTVLGNALLLRRTKID